VGEAADQGTRRVLLRQQVLLAADAQVTVEVLKLEQQRRVARRVDEWRDAQVHGDHQLGSRCQLDLALGEGMAAVTGLGEAVTEARIELQQVDGELTHRLARTDPEQHLPCRVDVTDDEALVEYQDRVAEAV
jgi:hypothetical protein